MTDKEAFLRILEHVGKSPEFYDNDHPTRPGAKLPGGNTRIGIEDTYSILEIEFNAEGKAVQLDIYN